MERDEKVYRMGASEDVARGGVMARIQARLPALTGASRAIADQLVDDPAAVLNGSITELAALSRTSPASVTRFCRAIGLAGCNELKLCLAGDLAQPTATRWTPGLGSSIGPDDPPAQVMAAVSDAAEEAIRLTLAQLEERDLVAAASAIVEADRCEIFGVGASSIVAMEAQLRLHAIGRRAWAYTDVHQAIAAAALMGPGSVSFGISRSGRTREVVEALEAARAQGATTIALTSYPTSQLAAVADICLTTPAHDITVRHGSFASRYSQLLVIDCLYSVVGQQTYETSTTALATATRMLAPRRHPPKEATPAQDRPPHPLKEGTP